MEKNEISVIIDGKVFVLTAEDNEEHMQKVASYINGKISECKMSENFKRMPHDRQALMIELNLADDYLKAKNKLEELREELNAKNEEIYTLKHESISLQIKVDSKVQEIESLKEEITKYQKNIVKLETELKESKK